MRSVDTHFHIWNLQENYYPWLTDKVQPRVIGDYAAIRKDYLVGDFLTDIAGTGVVKAVHIQAEHDASDPVRETRWLQAVADDPASRGFPHGIVAYADLGAADAEEVLAAHCEFPNMRGIRQSLIQHKVDPAAKDPRESPVWAENFKLMRKYGLSFDIQLFHPNMAFGAELIGAQPDVQFVLTHTGLPMRNEPDYRDAWRAGLRRLAERPNLAVKISGFGFIDRGWSVESIRPLVLETIDIFGTDRCMFASNFPVDGMSRSYAAYWDAFGRVTRSFSDAEREALFSGTAERVYRV
ncbi:amidohydrolase family protein [Methylobacterium sp. Gmos1]